MSTVFASRVHPERDTVFRSVGHNLQTQFGAEWLRQKTDIPHPKSNGSTLKIADLFCGCGGLSLGVRAAAEKYGMRVKIALALDINPAALRVFRDNFTGSDTTCVEAQIQDLVGSRSGAPPTQKEIAVTSMVGDVDMVLAGPPCQGHSDLNNSTRRKDPRNSLYRRVVRFAELTQPSAVLIENVPAVVHSTPDVVSEAQRQLARFGYSVSTMVVDLSSLGVAQKRRRHVLLAVKASHATLGDLVQSQVVTRLSVMDAIGDLSNASAQTPFDSASQLTTRSKRRIDFLFDHDLYDLPDSQRPPCHRNKAHTYKAVYGRLDGNRPSPTITSGFSCMGQGRFVHPTQRRTLTPHEAARLQGFPDFFRFSSATKRTALQEMIGNAVPPQLSAAVVSGLITSGILPPYAD